MELMKASQKCGKPMWKVVIYLFIYLFIYLKSGFSMYNWAAVIKNLLFSKWL